MELLIPGGDFSKLYYDLKDFIVYQSKSQRKAPNAYDTFHSLTIDECKDGDSRISCAPIKLTYHFGHSIPDLYKKEDLEIYDINKNNGFNIRISDLTPDRPIEIIKFHIVGDDFKFFDSSIEFGDRSEDIQYLQSYNQGHNIRFFNNIDRVLEIDQTWNFVSLINLIWSASYLYLKTRKCDLDYLV